ncbi:hypothetical protein MYAM1_001202 [Malassezia yamatoensis]|uniref:Ion transport domain-containing protein n=1 Tax=Malassezia yamatoensis TaxID=253288 RepID=A0AAJ6CG65_9BASI|nr:hypothetical protein MYAM1_001202 [Malassezia yamatoensis]
MTSPSETRNYQDAPQMRDNFVGINVFEPNFALPMSSGNSMGLSRRPAFYALELTVNLVLVAEVSIRFVAFGKHFWKSTFNVVDLCLVVLCLITLLVLVFGHGCSPYAQRPGRGEELLDSVLLIARNIVQCTRLLSVIRRSQQNVASRVTAIDLNDAHDYNLDLDFEQEGSLARQRMRDGGDDRAFNLGWTPHTRTSELQPKDTIIAVDDEVEL